MQDHFVWKHIEMLKSGHKVLNLKPQLFKAFKIEVNL
jgi:hypothetical protein